MFESIEKFELATRAKHLSFRTGLEICLKLSPADEFTCRGLNSCFSQGKWETDEITLQEGNLISSSEERYIKSGLDVSHDQKWPCKHINHFFHEFPTRKKYGVPSRNFVKKNVFCKIGDEITRFDGLYLTAIFFQVPSLSEAEISFSDPWHFDTNPEPWIRTLDYGSGSL
jgi:hypothetical protein